MLGKGEESVCKRKEYHDKSVSDLSPLSVGDRVLVQDKVSGKWNKRVTIPRHMTLDLIAVGRQTGTVGT